MPFLTPCPTCGARLKSASQLPAGQRLTCPVCHKTFITQAESEPFVTRKGRKGRGDLPDAILIDDDLDDRPPVGEPDEDRPPRRRRSAEPRPRKKPTPPALAVSLCLAGFALVLGVAVLAFFLVRESRRPAAHDLLAHAPAESIILTGFDLDELAGHESFRKALERRAPSDLLELDRAGLGTADLSRALVARTPNNGTTCVVRFKAAPDRAKYLGPDLPGRAYAPFVSLGGTYRFGYFADRTTLVLADTELAVQALRDKGPRVRLSAHLQDMVGRATGPVWRASGRVTAADAPRLGPGEDGLALRVGPSAGAAAWLVPDGPLGRVQFALAFDTPAEAAGVATILRSSFQVQRGLAVPFGGRDRIDPADVADTRRGYEEATVSQSGPEVKAQLYLPAGEALRAVAAIRH